MIQYIFKPTFSIKVVISFMLFTVIGTLSHELGHVTIAKVLGYDTTLHYGSMNYFPKGYLEDENLIEINQIVKTDNEDEFIKKDRYYELREILDEKYINNKKHNLFITLGGPLQTILTSFIGLFILYKRKSKSKKIFKLLDWLGVFLGLFILREVFNFVSALITNLVFNKLYFYGDEFKVSRYFEFNQWIVPAITCIIGFFISLYIIFKIVPIKYRFSFIISGFVGGVLGFSIWFGFLGSILLP